MKLCNKDMKFKLFFLYMIKIHPKLATAVDLKSLAQRSSTANIWIHKSTFIARFIKELQFNCTHSCQMCSIQLIQLKNNQTPTQNASN